MSGQGITVDPSEVQDVPAKGGIQVDPSEVEDVAPQSMEPGTFQTMPGGPKYNAATLGSRAIQYPTQSAAVSGAKARAGLPDFPQQVEAEKKQLSGQLTTVGSVLGSEAGPVGMGVGAAAGELMKPLLAGGSPDYERAAEVGVENLVAGKAFQYGMKAATAGIAKLAEPWLRKPVAAATEAELSKVAVGKAEEGKRLADAEEYIRQSITQAPKMIRKHVIDPLYPQIDTPVDIYKPSKQAVAGAKDLIANKAPGELNRTRVIGRQIGSLEKSIDQLIHDDRAGEPMHTAELLDTMQALKDRREISFDKAQQLRSALGRAMSSGQGHNIPGEVYQNLKSVHSLLDDAMQDAADAEGKMPQWKAAQAAHKQFMDDFYNKNAPLKGVLGSRENMTGATLGKLTNASTSLRARQALSRWGMKDQAKVLDEIVNRPGLKEDLTNMKRATTAPRGFHEEQLAKLKEADAERVAADQAAIEAAKAKRKKAIGAAVGGAGVLGAGYRILGHYKNLTGSEP